MAEELVGQRRKCPFCRKFLIANEEVAIYFNNHYYHNECFAKFDDSVVKNAAKTLENKEELIQYIKLKFKITTITPKISQQLKNLIDGNYKYEGILKTLEYFYDIKGNSPEKSNEGLGIVPYVYEEARRWYVDKFQKKETVEKNKRTVVNTIPEVVFVSIPEDTTVKKKMIDIENL